MGQETTDTALRIGIDGNMFELGTSQDNKFGIDNIKALASYVGQLAKKLNSYQADGKFSFWEKLQFGFEVGNGLEFATKIDKIISELNDLNQEELGQVSLHLNQEFGWDTQTVRKFLYGIFIPALTIFRQVGILSKGIPDFFKEIKA